jgi:CheY-like chemotaxis protein
MESLNMNKRIMIVDDNKEFLEELKETLELSGYEVVAVEEPEVVLDMANKLNPDLILLDLKMPNKSGFQIADELRRLPELSHTPIIAMTGFFKDDCGALLNICGINKCLKKPFSPLDVIAQIESAFKQ